MNACRKIITFLSVAAAMAVVPAVASAQNFDDRIRVQFSGPVEVPGATLPAGAYIFEALETGHLTRILSADGTHVFATVLTVPEEKQETPEKPEVVLTHNPNGEPEKVQSWFCPGDTIGNEFVYPKKHESSRSSPSVVGSFLKEDGRATESAAIHAEHAVVRVGKLHWL